MEQSADPDGRREIGGVVVGWWTSGDRVLLKLDDDRQVQMPMLEGDREALAPGLRAVVALRRGEATGWRLADPGE